MKRIFSFIVVCGALGLSAGTWWVTHSWWKVALTALGAALLFFGGKVWGQLEPKWVNRVATWLDRLFTSYGRIYATHIYYTNRTFDVKGISTLGKFALELEAIYVELGVDPALVGDIPQDPIRRPPNLLGKSQADIFAWLRAAPGRHSNFAVVGPPGSGKTTLLKHMALALSGGKSPLKITPLLVFLREFAAAIDLHPQLKLLDVIETSLRNLPPPQGWFERRLEKGRCLIMLDGLDEVASPDMRRKVVSWIERQVETFGANRFLVTSRPNGYRDNPLAGFTTLQLLPFGPEQVERFVRNWYLANELAAHQKDDPGVRIEADEGANDLLARLRGTPTLQELGVNPLLLTMIAAVHRYRSELPTRRVELFSEICEVFLGRRQQARGLELELTPAQKVRVLGKLAYEMTCRHAREILKFEAIETITSALKLVAPSDEPVMFLRIVEDSSGLLVEIESGIYSFAHRVFQDYLASRHIVENNLGDELISHLGNSWWEETILLYAEQSDATQLVKASLERQPPLLDLAVRLAGHAFSIHVSARKQLEEHTKIQQQPIDAIEKFFSAAGFTVAQIGDHTLEIIIAKGRLESFVPIVVYLAKDEQLEKDIVELKATAGARRNGPPLGILIYDSNPDTLARIKMADVRIRDGFFVIPLSLRVLEKTLANPAECFGLVQEQSSRYLPGADLFDDKTAIADTLTFFGRAGVLNDIQNHVLQLNSVGLFGVRKSGKTSVLLQLASALRTNPVIHCDLQKYGNSRFGAELFNEIIRRLTSLISARAPDLVEVMAPFPAGAPATDVAPEFERRFSTLASKASQSGYALPVVCLFDEVERIFPFPDEEREKVLEFNAFFGTLRSICQSDRRLALVVTDVHPDCNRINVWHQRGAGSNPVFAFFKEVFLRSFSEEDTRTMLGDIARLMGKSFDGESLHGIHWEAGGHPFLARQLASLVCRQNSNHTDSNVHWILAKQYVERPFVHSGLLKSYFAENLWQDLERRGVVAALDVLRIMGSSGSPGDWFDRRVLEARLRRDYSEDDWSGAILLLEEMDVVAREDREGLRYRLQIPLLGRWVRLRIKDDEVVQWQIN